MNVSKLQLSTIVQVHNVAVCGIQCCCRGNCNRAGDDSSTCQSCGIPLTVKHILVECANLRDIRAKYFTVSSHADLF